MITNKYCCKNINSGEFNFAVVLSEVKELVEAKNTSELKEEVSDVVYSFLCYIYDKTKISLPMFGASFTIKKAEMRFAKWETIFKNENLIFDKKYLTNGSNYEKPEKVQMALALAKMDIIN